MPIVDCLKSAQKAYQDIIDPEEIATTFEELKKYAANAKQSGSNLAQSLTEFAEADIRGRERESKALQLQQLLGMQTVVDNLIRAETWLDAGYSVSMAREMSLQSKMEGSPYKLSKGHENTNSKVVAGRSAFEREFVQDLQDKNALALWNSQEGELPIIKAMYDLNEGKAVEGIFGDIAKIVKKFKDKLIDKRRSVGIDINELEDRVTPNIHDSARILKLTREEAKVARTLETLGDKEYEFAFRRWNEEMLQRINADRVFKKHGIDPNNVKAVEDFQRKAFDEIVNKGKVTQKGVNLANKVKKPRVYHWKDAEALVRYNSKFGSGSIQDSITRELSFGFGNIELIRDWSVNPITTLERTLKLFDENPRLAKSKNKAKEAARLTNRLSALMTHDHDFPSTLASIGAGIRSYTNMTHMGSATIASIGADMLFLAKELARAGVPAFERIPLIIKNFMVGMSETDKRIFVKEIDNALTQEVGQVARYYIEPYKASSIPGKGVQLMYKLNLMGRWDRSKGLVAFSLARKLARHKDKSWERLDASDKKILDEYGIEPVHWNALRQSEVKVGSGGKTFITPDSIQEVPDSVIIEQLKTIGEENPNAARIQDFRDEVERKVRGYFQDRMDHAIQSPNQIDANELILGIPKENEISRFVARMFIQFRSFLLPQWKRGFKPLFYENGATNMREALWGGKNNLTGVAGMTGKIMAGTYAAISAGYLLQGKSPPGLDKPQTWLRILSQSLGFVGMVTDVNPTRFRESAAKIILPPAFTDIGKFLKFGYQLGEDIFVNNDFDKSKQAGVDFIKTGIPFANLFYAKYAMNNLIFNRLQDAVDPDRRDSDLAMLEKTQGVTQLF